MSLYKRKKTWWVYLVTPSGKKIRRSTNTSVHEEAKVVHDLLKAELIKSPARVLKGNRTFEEAGQRWLKETTHKASHAFDMKIISFFTECMGKTKLREISNDLIQEVVCSREPELTPSTINRYLEVMRALLRKAEYEWEWLERAPKIRMRKVQNRRVRFLSREELGKLLEQLPEHHRNLATFAVLTGLRQSNITNLKWDQVDLQLGVAWIHPDQSKTRKAIGVPLNRQAIELLKSLRNQHPEYVFTFRGQQIKQVNTKAWHAALKRAGIEDFRWHDLRHTWATWHIQAGTPPHVLQELGGWASYEMVRRYAHLNTAYLSNYAANVNL